MPDPPPDFSWKLIQVRGLPGHGYTELRTEEMHVVVAHVIQCYYVWTARVDLHHRRRPWQDPRSYPYSSRDVALEKVVRWAEVQRERLLAETTPPPSLLSLPFGLSQEVGRRGARKR